MRVKIFIFTLEVRTEEQGTRKEEVEKQLNKGIFEQLKEERKNKAGRELTPPE